MSSSKDNIRIAKNTIVVYIRLIVTAVIGLLTSRYVLQILGASDFGLYSVIGGVIAMFTFISVSLQATTVRFINFEMGKQNSDLNKVFNTARQIHVFFAVIIFLIAELVGMYYIQHYLNVDSSKLSDAYYVFHVSIVAACIGIVNVPYQGLLVAHEKFFYVACIDIFNVICKLLMVLMLLYMDGDVLRLYALSMSLLTILSFVCYLLICWKYWPAIVQYKIVKSFRQHKEMLVFNNYTLLTTISLMIRNQGSNLLINFFFGTVVNAAYAISNTVHVYVNTFAGSFDQASAPQITQNLSKGNHERAFYLVDHTCRICILLVEIVYFTLIAELDFVLRLWLGDNVPEGTAVFCKLTLLLAVVSATSGGLVQYINALGKLKYFSISMASFYAIGLVLSVIVYRLGGEAWTIVAIFLVIDGLNRIIQLLILKYQSGFPVMDFVKKAYIRPLIVFALGCLLVYEYHQVVAVTGVGQIVGMAGIMIVMSLLVFWVGLYNSERGRVLSVIIQKIEQIW